MANTGSQRDALWQAWTNLQALAQEALNIGTVHYFKCIKQTVANQLALDALANCRLGQSDERIYNHLLYLMQTYQETVGLFAAAKQEQAPLDVTEEIDADLSPPAPDLVAGLCDVLNSRLRQFEDVDTGTGNPVTHEKRAILEKAIIRTIQQIDAMEAAYIAPESLSPNWLIAEPTAWEPLLESIQTAIITQFTDHYQQNLAHALASLSDMHTRTTASFYADLLEREWEVLGLIIQVQVRAIESTHTEDFAPILSKLREAYQQTGPVVSGFRKLMQSAPGPKPQVQPFSFDELPAPTPVEMDVQPLISVLMCEADILFEGIRVKHLESTLETQQNINDEIAFAEEIISIFDEAENEIVSALEAALECDLQAEELLEAANLDTNANNDGELDNIVVGADLVSARACENSDTEEQPEACTNDTLSGQTQERPQQHTNTDLACASCDGGVDADVTPTSKPHKPPPEIEILTGIIETLEIKVDSLQESLESHKEATSTMLSALSNIPTLTGEELQLAASQLLAAWCLTPPTQDTIDEFLANPGEVITAYNDKLTKHIANNQAKLDKISLRYKKEALLYEISTFEEILYYSVSRLRESTLPHVAAAVQILDETIRMLEALITNRGITIIRPNPHEPFNGREHEVLTAEEQEGFAKGQIIKTMVSGYKQNDQVIIRANVVAAR